MPKSAFRIAALLAAVCCLLTLTACGDKPTQQQTDPTPTPAETPTETPVETPVETPSEPPVETPSEPPVETVAETPVEPTAAADGVLKKVSGAADQEGIYAVVVTLSEQAADRGVVEMVYTGAQGTPQENSVVNTFRIEYYREDAGTFEVHTFFDGEVYQNLHHQDQVKVNNTFGAALRAGDVVISYAPEGEELQEVYRADAEQFRAE